MKENKLDANPDQLHTLDNFDDKKMRRHYNYLGQQMLCAVMIGRQCPWHGAALYDESAITFLETGKC